MVAWTDKRTKGHSLEWSMEDNTGITRRDALRDPAGIPGWPGSGAGSRRCSPRLRPQAPNTGSLKDIEHVVILIQENRSFDHYFGMLPGVRGFSEKQGHDVFYQHRKAGKTIHPSH